MKLRQLLFCGLFACGSLFAQQAGDRDMTFNATDDGAYGYGSGGELYDAVEQTDGKIILIGAFNNYNERKCSNNIIRINADGGLDETFLSGTGVNANAADFTVTKTSLLSNGKILITGSFTSYNGVAVKNIALLNQDGTLDTSFNPGTSAVGIKKSIVLPDGKIIIYGSFTTYNGVARQRIARINPDGSLDTTFNTGSGTTNGVIDEVKLQPDGKLILVGKFTTFNGVSKVKIVRINEDGSIDSSFTTGTGANLNIYSFDIQSDGKIVLGGNFGTYNSVASSGIARLNSDGTLDTTFNIGTGALDVRSIKVITNDQIVVTGSFLLFNNITKKRVVRLNSDGSIDTSF